MDIKTVDGSASIMDPLYQRQKENIEKMRTSVLACTEDNGVSTRQAIQNITAMRVYHQLTRIVQYLELMDKLEKKLYESIEYNIDNSQPDSPETLIALLNIQERLQKSMIESHKLLQPYLDVREFTVVDLGTTDSDASQSQAILEPEKRDKLRSTAQSILLAIQEESGDAE